MDRRRLSRILLSGLLCGLLLLQSSGLHAAEPQPARTVGTGTVELSDGFVYRTGRAAARPLALLAAPGDTLDQTGKYRSVLLTQDELLLYDVLSAKLGTALQSNQFTQLETGWLTYSRNLAHSGGRLTADASAEFSGFLHNVIQAFLYDHPQAFWIMNQYGYSYSFQPKGDGEEMQYDLHLLTINDVEGHKLTYAPEQFLADNTQIQQEIAAVLASAQGMTDFEKVTHFSGWLTSHNKYSSDVNVDLNRDPLRSPYGYWCWSLQSAFLSNTNKKPAGESANGPVCEAYSKAMKILCDRSGIPCVLASGQGHMWNYVKLGCAWYGMDVTWNDPVFQNTNPVEVASMQFTFQVAGSSEKVPEFLDPVTPGDFTENQDCDGVTNWSLLGQPRFETLSDGGVPKHQRYASDVSHSLVLAQADFDPTAGITADWDGSTVRYEANALDAQLMVARYDGGRLTDLSFIPCDGPVSGSCSPGGSGSQIKLFLVSSTSRIPLCTAAEPLLTPPAP